mgnify:CR=1 FL=1
MNTQILAWIMDVFFIVTLHILYEQLLGRKYKNRYSLFVGWSLWFLSWNFCTYLFAGKPLINGICSMIINYVILHFLYSGTIQNKVVILFIVLLFGVLSEGTIMTLLDYFRMNVSAGKILEQDYFFLGNALSKVVWFILVKAIAVIAKKRKQLRIGIEEWLEVFMVPVGSIIICFAAGWEDYYRITGSNIVIWVVVLSINLATYYIYQKMQEHAAELLDKELLEQQNAYYKMRYNDTKQQWDTLAKIRHDMKNNYVLELSYLENKEYKRLEEYYKSVLGELKEKKNLVHTGNINLDALLNYKIEIAGEHGIVIDKNIKVSWEINLKGEEISALFGNLLDNAIESVNNLPKDKRKIWLSISSDKTALLIEVKNLFQGERKRDKEGNLITGKQDKEKHGIGLKVVNDIVRTHKGTLETLIKGNMFIVKAFLYMQG